MISLDDAVIARLTSHGHHFEILVDPTMAAEAKEKDLPLTAWVASNEIYKDSSKAEKASEETLKEAFGTTDFEKVARRIIDKGDIQVTTEQRKKIQEEKKKQKKSRRNIAGAFLYSHYVLQQSLSNTFVNHPCLKCKTNMEYLRLLLIPL